MANLQSSTSTYTLDESLSPTDQELFSLFLQYPEIDFDNEEPPGVQQAAKNTNRESSPVTGSDRSTFVDDSDSTRTLTPSPQVQNRQHYNTVEEQPELWREFISIMRESNLPDECLSYYTSLGQNLVALGAELFATLRPSQQSLVTPRTIWLLKNVTYSSNQAMAQIERINYLRTLTAFNVKPIGLQLWSAYTQRAKLITTNLALPCKHELDLIHMLVLLYDSCAYHDFLQTSPSTTFDDETSALLNNLYNALMTWLYHYKQWCKGMAELRYKYMQPLIDGMAKAPEAQDELKEFQERMSKARDALRKPLQSNEEMSEKVVEALNLSARKPAGASILKRTKTRYKREHTV